MIWKDQEWAMSGSSKCKDNLNFCTHYGAAEKNQEKVKAISALVSQSVEFSFSGKIKIQMLTTFAGVWHCPSTAFLITVLTQILAITEPKLYLSQGLLVLRAPSLPIFGPLAGTLE